MLRPVVVPIAALGTLALGLLSCTPAPPPPMDISALPTATTSAEPLFLTSEKDAAIEQGDAAVPRDASADEGAAALLPTDFDAHLERSVTCPTKHCFRASIVPRPHETKSPATAAYPELGAKPPVAVWQEVLGPDVKVEFPRVKGLSLCGVVLRGVMTFAAAEGGTLAALEPWRVFLAPGAGIALQSNPEGASVLLVAFADQGALDPQLATARRSPGAVYWEKRPAPVVLHDLEGVDDVAWASGEAHARFGLHGSESPRVYLGALITAPTLPVAAHQHEKSWEILVPLRAQGTLVLAPPSGGGTAPREVPVRSGTVVTVPSGVRHAWKPTGEQPLLAIQLFLPPGPEQRYLQLAGHPAQPGATPGAPASASPPR